MCNVWILDFFIFQISDIGLLWSKIALFIIEISLKLHTFTFIIVDEITQTHTGWAWKVLNFIFCHFWELKNLLQHKHSNSCHALNFHRKLIFFKTFIRMVSIRINNNWNYPKTSNYRRTVPLRQLTITQATYSVPCSWQAWKHLLAPVSKYYNLVFSVSLRLIFNLE